MSTIQLITDKLAETGKTGTDLCIYLELPRATLQNWKTRKSHTYMTRLKEIGKFLGVSVKELKDAADEKEKEKMAPDGKEQKTGTPVKNEEKAATAEKGKKAVKSEEATTAGKAKKENKAAESTVNAEKQANAPANKKSAKKKESPVMNTVMAPRSEPTSEELLAEMDKLFLTLPYEAQIVLVNNARLMKKV